MQRILRILHCIFCVYFALQHVSRDVTARRRWQRVRIVWDAVVLPPATMSKQEELGAADVAAWLVSRGYLLSALELHQELLLEGGGHHSVSTLGDLFSEADVDGGSGKQGAVLEGEVAVSPALADAVAAKYGSTYTAPLCLVCLARVETSVPQVQSTLPRPRCSSRPCRHFSPGLSTPSLLLAIRALRCLAIDFVAPKKICNTCEPPWKTPSPGAPLLMRWLLGTVVSHRRLGHHCTQSRVRAAAPRAQSSRRR